MHVESIAPWKHEHTFGQDHVRPGEKNTRLVIALTATMMLVEIAAGIGFGSMALLADGLHMGSHTIALGISALAYFYARKYAADRRFNFGTGKANTLAGYTSAVLLAVFAFTMAWESIRRMFNPVPIEFNLAILVAVIGLIVNAVSVWILRDRQPHSHSHDHAHPGQHADPHTDHNLRSAYLHVLADALTSVLAIVALLGGKFLGLVWMDPLMGLVGAVLVARWSVGLIREAMRVLLDQQGPAHLHQSIRQSIESQDDNRICDLHLWSIGPGVFAAAISIVTDAPKPPEEYKRLIPDHLGLVHATVEVHPCRSC
ncbi:MAG TPA: CDF family Co(II)/Ni(II) efflux transporter DmeF [Anaerolineales bacterium]|nr:CDF family Co(II)/Ni(II) efflux transporter DmeF [Anaerolineales bacterium]